MTLIVHTARVSRHLPPDALDITRSTADRLAKAGKAAPGEFLAPTAALVYPTLRALKVAPDEETRAAIWYAYSLHYRDEMRMSYRWHRAEWDALLGRDRVVLCCFCADAARCHRTLAAAIFGRLGADVRGEALPVVTNRTASNNL